MCLQFLRLLESPSSLLAGTLPTLGSMSSANRVNSKTISAVDRICGERVERADSGSCLD